MITPDDLMKAARGLPTSSVVSELGRFTPGVTWRGCGKRDSFGSALIPAGRFDNPWLSQERAALFLAWLAELREIMAERGLGFGDARTELWRREWELRMITKNRTYRGSRR